MVLIDCFTQFDFKKTIDTFDAVIKYFLETVLQSIMNEIIQLLL